MNRENDLKKNFFYEAHQKQKRGEREGVKWGRGWSGGGGGVGIIIANSEYKTFNKN